MDKLKSKKQRNLDEKKRLRRGYRYSFILVIIAIYFTGIMSIISTEGSEVGAIGIFEPITQFIGTFSKSIQDFIKLVFYPSKIIVFLKDKNNAVLIYAIMIFFLVQFLRLVKKRIKFLEDSIDAKETAYELLEKSDKEKHAVLDKYKNDRNIEQVKKNVFFDLLIGIFDERIRKESSYVINSVRDELIDTDYIEYDYFMEQVQRSYVWIIRLGIIGTLFGIMIAFYEMADGIQELLSRKTPDPLKEFQEAVKRALEGNAIAVVSSLVAHSITLAIEYFISKRLVNKSNVEEILKMVNSIKYDELELKLDFTPFKGDLESIKKNVDSAKEKSQKINEAFNRVNIDDIRTVESNLATVKATSDELEKTTVELKKLVEAVKRGVRSVFSLIGGGLYGMKKCMDHMSLWFKKKSEIIGKLIGKTFRKNDEKE